MKDARKTKASLIAELKALREQASRRDLEKKIQDQIAELKQCNQAQSLEISNRIEIESRLKESNELLTTVFSNIHMLIAYLDTDFNFIRVNEAYAQAAGRPALFFPGKNHFALFPHEENEQIFRNVVASGKAYTVYEKPFVYPGHPERVTYWDWTLRPVTTDRREVFGLILSLFDVTTRVEARKKAEAYAAELEWQNKALSEFAFIASHDLQEPLRKILTFGDRLKSCLTDRLTPNATDYLERMQGAARRMQAMLDGLLQYAHVTSQTQPCLVADLTRAAQEAVSNLQVRIEETGATVVIEPLPTLCADFSQMLQLFQNLIGNALKFHRKGVPPHVRVAGKIISPKDSGDPNGQWGELRVEDNGIGFDPQYIDRIFLPFERLYGRSGPEGVGMGLTICRKIVKRHGGGITAASEPGNGSLFVVTLPVTSSNKEKALE